MTLGSIAWKTNAPISEFCGNLGKAPEKGRDQHGAELLADSWYLDTLTYCKITFLSINVVCIFLLQCMMSLELLATETAWFSVIFTLTLWIISSQPLVRMQSSDRCGQNLSGKTRLVLLSVCHLGFLLDDLSFSFLFHTNSLYQHYLMWYKPHSDASVI